MANRTPVSEGLAMLALMRPRQWVKNAFVFAALVFAGKLGDARLAWLSVRAFVAFCALSSAVYIINDLADVEEDRRHPAKKDRPIASGRLGAKQAAPLAVVCFAVGMALCATTGTERPALLAVGLAYVVLHLLYTVWAKHLMLVDVICIAVGFVLRAVAGGVAIDVPVSRWLLACTFALCMFLGFGKRRCEIAQLGDRSSAANHRATLWGYTLPLLDQLLSVSSGVAVVAFLLYSIKPETPPLLFYSTPLVVFCIFRVSLLVEAGRVSGPTEAVTRDVPFVIGFGLWCIYAAVVATWGSRLMELLSRLP